MDTKKLPPSDDTLVNIFKIFKTNIPIILLSIVELSIPILAIIAALVDVWLFNAMYMHPDILDRFPPELVFDIYCYPIPILLFLALLIVPWLFLLAAIRGNSVLTRVAIMICVGVLSLPVVLFTVLVFLLYLLSVVAILGS